MEEKLITIASFTFSNDSSVLESIFQSEGIEYAIDDTTVLSGPIETLLKVKESDMEKATRIMKESGFESNLTQHL